MVPPLKALDDEYSLTDVTVSTLQAVSGAGYSGVTSMEIIDNAIPHIGGEEQKMESESRKLLGSFDGAEVHLHDMGVAASCNRIATIDGHLENVWADTADDVTAEGAAETLAAMPNIDLPSSPRRSSRCSRNPNAHSPVSTGRWVTG